jgi:outer membrane protein OmpA-like peptidoglycan-associated protein
MGNKNTFLKFAAALIAAVALVFAGLTPANATHLRGAVGTLVYDASAKTVTLTSTMVERKDACPSATSTGTLCSYFAFPTITAVTRSSDLDTGTAVKTCTGQSTTPVSSYDNWSQPLYNIFTTTYVINVACPNFNTANDFVFEQTGNARIGGIKNALTNQVIQFQGRIKIDGTNNSKSPVYNSGYMTNVPYNVSPSAVFTTNLNALDGDGRSVTYSLITNQSAATGGYGGSDIPCSDLNTTTGDFRISASLCTGTEDYVKAFSGGTDAAPIYYVLKTKALGANNQYVTRDVLLAFDSNPAAANAVPTITRVVSDGSIVLSSGNTTTVVYTALDTDSGQSLAWSTNTLPSWATFTTTGTVGTSPSSPRSSTLTLVMTPPSGTNAALKILVSVQDNAPFPLSATNELAVSVGSAILPPGAPTINTQSTTGAGTSTISAPFTPPTVGGIATSYSCSADATDGSSSVTGTYTQSPTTCTFNSLNTGKNYSITVTASNAAGSAISAPYVPASATATIAVSKNPVNLTTNQYSGAAPYGVTVTNIASGAVKTYSTVGSLPTGLAIDPATGVITGTLTSAGTYTVNLKVSSDATDPKVATTTFAIVVADAGIVTQTITFPDLGIIPVQSFASSPSASPSPIVNQTSASANNSNNTSIHWVPLRAYTNAPGGGTIKYSTPSGTKCSIKQINSTGVTYVGYKGSTNNWGNNNSWAPTDNLTCVIQADAVALSGFTAAATVKKTIYINMGVLLNANSSYPNWSTVTAFRTKPSNGQAVATPLGASTLPSLDTFDSALAPTGNYLSSTLPLKLVTGVRLNHPLRYTLRSGTYAPTYCMLGAWTGSSLSSAALPPGISFDVKDCNLYGTPTQITGQSGVMKINYCNPLGCSDKSITIEVTAAPKLPQVITFTKPLDTDFHSGSKDATDAKSDSGLPVTLSSDTVDVCTTEGLKIVHVAAGTCTVEALQNAVGSTFYEPATPQIRSYILKDSAHLVPAPLISAGGQIELELTVFTGYPDKLGLNNTGGGIDVWEWHNSSDVIDVTPDGLFFDASSGTLSGTPEEAQERTLYKVRAYNNNHGSSDAVDVYITIKKLGQSITFPALSGMKATDTIGQGLGAITDSGLPVVYRSATPTICEVVSGTVKPIAGKVGTCTIVATQPGDATTYNAAISQTRSFTIVAGLQPPKLALTNYNLYFKRGTSVWVRPFDPINLGGELPATNAYSIDVIDSSNVRSNSVSGLTFNRDFGIFEDANPTWGTDITYTIVVTATNAAGSDSKTFTLVLGLSFPQYVSVSLSGDVTDLNVGDPDLDIITASTSDIDGQVPTGLAWSSDSVDPASALICSIVNGKIHALKFGDCVINTIYSAGTVSSGASPTGPYAPGYGTRTIKIHEAPTLKVNGTTAAIIEVATQQQLTESLYALAATGDPGTFTIQDTSGHVIDLASAPLANGGVATFDDISGAILGTVAATTGQESFVIVLTNNVGSAQVQITLKYSRASTPNTGGGNSSAPGKVILKTPAPITTGTKNEKTGVLGGPSGSTLTIITKELPKQVLNASISNGTVVIETEASFTGIVEVPVEVKLASGEVQLTSTLVTVNPQAPTNVVSEQVSNNNSITWNSALGAVTYQVLVNGVVVCTTSENTCLFKGVLAADAKITVASLGRQSTFSAAIPAVIKKAGVKYTLLKTVDNFAKSSATLTIAMKKILDAAIAKIKKLGLKTLVIEGHADGEPAAANVFSKISIARANAVKGYLAPKLKGVSMTVKGLGMDIPVASNKTVAGQAKNRRATVFATN